MTTNKSGKGTGKGPSPAGAKRAAAGEAYAARGRVWLVCVLLVAVTFAVFGRTVNFDFVNLDDDIYVSQNPLVAAGLTAAGVARAFAHGSLANWDPLTTLSHMLDCQFFGLKPAGHHLVNVLLHAASVVLLFLVLRRMTGALWRSALVAALFAIHPLRVESVAWVTERKDVLSGLFFMLTLAAYVRYARQPGRSAYLVVVGTFALALMSKAMVVTLPLILLVLDWWPLKRMETREGAPGTARLLREKVPLLAMSGIVGVVSLIAQNQAYAVQSLEKISPATRLGNALVSCGWYVEKLFWPSELAVWYPYPMHGLPADGVIAGALVLALVTTAAVLSRRERPYLLAGWLWFLVMLLPVIGLIQFGAQARADRYTYLPEIGLLVALSWLLGGATKRWPRSRAVIAGAAVLGLAALGAGAYVQTGYWRNSEKLWTHTLACTTDNAVADYSYGTLLAKSGHLDAAREQFQIAVELQPDYAEALNNLAFTDMEEARVGDAITNLERALRAKPDFADAHNNLGRAFAHLGRWKEAAREFELALQEQPDFADAHFNFANLLDQAKYTNEAIAQYETVLALQPDNFGAHNNLGTVLLREGLTNEAIAHFKRVLDLQPNQRQARDNLNRIAWSLATSPQASERNGARALELAKWLMGLSGGTDPVHLATLAAAEAETGQYADAADHVAKAQKMAADGGETMAADQLGAQLRLYEAHVPYRDTNAPGRAGSK